MVLKPNLVLPGALCTAQVTTADIAEATVECLRRTVPAAVPGVAFLSGGQRPIEATERLDAINRLGPHPWRLTFSFARAQQGGRAPRMAGARSPTLAQPNGPSFIGRDATQQRRAARIPRIWRGREYLVGKRKVEPRVRVTASMRTASGASPPAQHLGAR
jgi:hypothetical protein